MFADNNEYEVTGEGGAVDESIEMIRNKRPDLILPDINLAQSSGMDAALLIREYLHPQQDHCRFYT